MPRTLLNDWRTGHLFRTPTRGKCKYDRHESVTLVDGQWWGETSHQFECDLAPQDVCQMCQGAGEAQPTEAEAVAAQYESPADRPRPKPCPNCRGSGYQPGPHWPFQAGKVQPPPLRVPKP